MTERINYDTDGEQWVWMRPEICDQCAEKCMWWTYHKLQHKQKNYEMNQVRLYLNNLILRASGDLSGGCKFILEHLMAQDGSQPQVDDRRPLHDRCRPGQPDA
jgi:hypothetical protein